MVRKRFANWARISARAVVVAMLLNGAGPAFAEDAPPPPVFPDTPVVSPGTPAGPVVEETPYYEGEDDVAAPVPPPVAAPVPEPVVVAEPVAIPETTPVGLPWDYAGPRFSLLVFPFDSTELEGEGRYHLGSEVAKFLKDSTLRSPKYNGVTYTPRHPAIRRALEENTLRESEVAPPFGLDPDQTLAATRVARTMEIPKLLLGVVEGLEVNPETRQVTLTVTAQVLDAVSGRVEDTFVASGTSPAGATGSEEMLAIQAAEAAALQLGQNWIPRPKPEPVVANGETATNGEGDRRKKDNKGLLAGLAVLLGIIIAAGSGGGGGGTSLDQPPAPPF